MNSGPTSDTHLANTLHNHPDAYWCGDCWKWRLDCEHLVEPLSARRLLLNDWLLIYAAYDRDKRVLEICFSHRVRHQYRNVPLAAALALVRASDPAHYWKENIERQYRNSAQVRGRYHTERAILIDGAGNDGNV
jgi:KTSC domain